MNAHMTGCRVTRMMPRAESGRFSSAAAPTAERKISSVAIATRKPSPGRPSRCVAATRQSVNSSVARGCGAIVLIRAATRNPAALASTTNALYRFNRSYEYDSITSTYSQFLIDEFLPAIEAKHGLKLSTDPNHAAISGNSSGGICVEV